MSSFYSNVSFQQDSVMPFHFRCLYCGKLNHDELVRSFGYNNTVSANTKAAAIQRQKEEQNKAVGQVLSQIEQYEKNQRSAIITANEALEKIWQDCQKGIKPDLKRRVGQYGFVHPIKKAVCSHCKKEQPYSKRISSSVSTGFVASVTAGIVGILFGIIMAIIYIVKFLAKAEHDDPTLFLIFAIVFGAIGLIGLILTPIMIKKLRTTTSQMLYDDFYDLPYHPEYLPQFDDKADNIEK